MPDFGNRESLQLGLSKDAINPQRVGGIPAASNTGLTKAVSALSGDLDDVGFGYLKRPAGKFIQSHGQLAPVDWESYCSMVVLLSAVSVNVPCKFTGTLCLSELLAVRSSQRATLFTASS